MKKRLTLFLLGVSAADSGLRQSAGHSRTFGRSDRGGERRAGGNGRADTNAGADGGTDPSAALCRGGGDRVCPLCEGKSDGAKALSIWLRSSGKDVAESFIPDGLDKPMYTFPAGERASDEIPAVTDETRHVRVAADTELLESGILAAWLPAFESATGYIAEVYAGDASVLASMAASGETDVLLMKKADASALGAMPHYPTRCDLVSTIYSVI